VKTSRIAQFKAGTAPLVMGLALIATPAFAQDAAEGEDSGEDIIVTGSLIANPNVESSSPVSVIGADEVSLRGSNTAEQILRELPGATPNIGQNVNNGNNGSARVDLRNLGANRNIVLLDGQRLVPSSFFGAVDLNNIPLALVDRVDVLTGGASTTYGADAVSGVVNFITRRDFTGVDLSVSNQITEEGDGHTLRADLTLGASFDDGRGNAVLSIGYQEADPIYFGARDVATFTITSGATGGVASGDSPTSVPTAFSTADGQFRQIAADNGSLVPFYSSFNFNPFNIFQTPFERFNFYSAANYEVSDSVEIYSRALFSRNTVRTIIAPSGIFGAPLTVPGQNPYLNATIRNQLCTSAGIALGATCDTSAAIPLGAVYRRTTELGPRVSTYVTTVFDVNVGARVSITDSLKLDVYGSYGESENAETRSGYVANSRLQQSLNATNVNTCNVNTNGCVPVNLFGQAGSITPAMAGFIGGITSTITNAASLAQAHAVLSGDLGFTIPSASQPVSFAIGAEHRDYGAQRRPDSLAQIPGELGGAGGAVLPLNGGYNVYEAFGELSVPIASDTPFFNELTAEAGVRYSSYSVNAAGNPRFNSTTYKFGLLWEPVDGIRLRGNYQRAVRAPNIGELFAPVVTGLDNLLVDPCAGSSLATLTGGAANPAFNAGLVAGQNLRAVCLAQGAPAATIDSAGGVLNPAAGQANVTGGGNPNIRPETATTYTVGVVLQPGGFLDGLTATLDYYNIEVENAITSATPGDIIQACFGSISAASATNVACTGIRRAAINGRLSGTSTAAAPIPGLPQPLTNLGFLATSGIDLSLNWRNDLGFAELSLGFNGNYTFNSEFRASPTSYLRDCVGYYSVNCPSIQPEYQFNQRTTLSFDNVDVSLYWRHIGAVDYEGQAADFAARGFSATNRNLFNGTITGRGALVGRQLNFNRIPSYNYFDLTVRFDVTENLEFTLQAYNLFNKEPPIVGSSAGATAYNGGNTYPSTYDAIGRRYGAAIRMRF
jgi:iron complex outermembrane recepter protein